MSVKELDIPFKIVKVEENQFSSFEDILDKDGAINQKIGFGFGADLAHKTIAVVMEFMLQKNELPLLKQEITCYFEIEEIAFEKSIKIENKLLIPCGFAKHLAMITTGTARGVLFANTKNTVFNQFLIGLINVDNLFDNDITIEI